MKRLTMLRRTFVGVFFSASALMANPLTEGLVAHYPMNELNGDNVEDVSGNDRTAFGDFIEVVDGLGGKVFSFDGQKSAMFLPDDKAFEVTGDYSVAFWVRVAADSEATGPIYSQPDFSIKFFKGSLRITIANPDYPKTGFGDMMGPSINDGNWHHVAFTYDGEIGQAILYLDGLEVMSGIFAHKPVVTIPTTVGNAGRFFFPGELSDLRVYSRPLDVADVTSLHDLKSQP